MLHILLSMVYIIYIIHRKYIVYSTCRVYCIFLLEYNLLNENQLLSKSVRGRGIAMLILTFSEQTSDEG